MTWRISKKAKSKHIPKRTCVACRKTQDKQAMIRIVNTPDSGLQADTSGKMPGRGAYLCKDISCWEKGLTESRLEHSLGTHINPARKDILRNWIKEYLNET